MYVVHTTPGIIIGKMPVGEANMLYDILTRDLGLLQAQATSVRKIESKLRYNLELFSRTDISMVRGKQTWRLTNARGGESLLPHDTYKVELMSEVSDVILRLLPRNEVHAGVYELLEAFLEELKQPLSAIEITRIRIVMFAALLALLGYLEIPAEEITWEITKKFVGEQSVGKIETLINQGLMHAHL